MQFNYTIPLTDYTPNRHDETDTAAPFRGDIIDVSREAGTKQKRSKKKRNKKIERKKKNAQPKKKVRFAFRSSVRFHSSVST